MNERIRELAEQAGLEFDDDLALEPEPIYYATETDVYKFAELIVKECIDWCNAYVSVDGTAQKIVESIKKDFGVDDDQA